MTDYKNQVILSIFTHLFNDILLKPISDNVLVDVGVNFIEFARTNPKLFQTLYLDKDGGGHLMFEQSRLNYSDIISDLDDYKDLPDEIIDRLHLRSWITVIGLATLVTSGNIRPTTEEIKHIIEKFVLLIAESARNAQKEGIL
jgi:hypothetical protein